ncbi:hypothetical protein BV394_16135 (plasmid) [Brevirhabdus pacifica]|uniref:Methyltransferase family protein n=1 Tax=Brevirhabdus pacifica TaxID=1267768 RepID=A0A1P8QYH0_9RHOB|nr:class I SAM-dependent methyltransferase [Brevirhabdus pacifica]APX91417.1 hypothetical protein BV394_16135 [Brevirhabdus pacifica]OWU74218.1 hypothetical protein ATO5_14915 [Loktanella sp. 22II-4b]
MAQDRCTVCGQGPLDSIDATESLRYFACSHCGLCIKQVRDGGQREDFELGQASYYEDEEVDPFQEPTAIRKERAARRAQVLSSYVVPGRKVLEIGPGGGQLADWIVAQGAEYTGCEHSQVLTQKLRERGLNVSQGEFETLAFPEQVDLVLSFHIIEHVPEPLAQIEKAFEVTRPGGHFILGTPNAKSWEQRMLPRLSANFDIGHLHVFSPESLRIMAQEAGWTVERVWTSEYTSDWLRLVTKTLRRLKGEDEVASAGKYSRAASSGRVDAIISGISTITAPFRKLQAGLRGGNEIIMVLRKPLS